MDYQQLVLQFQRYQGRIMKLAKIYEIQKNYKMHKDRLLSINNINKKAKTITSLHNNLHIINQHKRTKILSELHSEKQKIDKIWNENEHLRNRMIEVSKRQNELIKEKSFMRCSSKSLKRQSLKDKFAKQNIRLKDRLMHTKSNYYHLHNNKQKKHKKPNKNQQIISLLENHFGIKPSVIFPHVRKREGSSVARRKKESYHRNRTQSNTQGLNNAKERHSLSVKYSKEDILSV